LRGRPIRIEPLPMKKAQARFLARFEELTEGHGAGK
jgi:hypothetical protein